MKKLHLILIPLILSLNSIFAQENLFVKSENPVLSKEASEKLERYKLREDLKNWELLQLRTIIAPLKGVKGIFNIMDNNIEFEIIREIKKGFGGRIGYVANLKEGGYAILSFYKDGVNASIWFMNRFFSVELIENSIYLITEIDMDKITKNENPDNYSSINKLKKINGNSPGGKVLTPATIKVFVAYTDDVAQYYDEYSLIEDCWWCQGSLYSPVWGQKVSPLCII